MSHIQCITYRRKNSHLTYEERLNLEKIIKENDKRPKKDKLSKVCIAKMMGISRATLYRELERGKTTVITSHYEFYESYSADIAQDLTAFNATNKGRPLKIEEDPRLIAYFEDTIIRQNYSPDAAIMALKNEANEFNVIISTRTLYNYIDKGYLGMVMMSDLPRQGKSAKRRYRRRRQRPIDLAGQSIEKRPVEANQRTEFGHWEMDCIESVKKDQCTLLTLVERQSRTTLIYKMTSQTQGQVLNVINQLETELGAKQFKALFKSITVDNGSEFLDASALMTSQFENDSDYRTQIYYCHPYAPHERGTNEVINAHIRRFIPKGAVLSDYSLPFIQTVQDWLNHYPRRILKGKSAHQIFEEKFNQPAA